MLQNTHENIKYNRHKSFLYLFISLFMFFLSLSCFFKENLSIHNIKIHLLLLGFFLFFIVFILIFPRKTKKIEQNKTIFFIESIIFIIIACIGFIGPGVGIHIFEETNNFFGINNSISIILLIHGFINLYYEYFYVDKPSFNKFFMNLLIFSIGMHLVGDPYKLENQILQILFYIFVVFGVFYFILFSYFFSKNKTIKEINDKVNDNQN